jgi:hypothetical protein
MKAFPGNSYIPTLQIRDGCIVLYTQVVRDRIGGKFERVKKAYDGRVTKGVQKRIGSAVDIFLQTTEEKVVYNTVTGRNMNFRLGFVTLTISDYCDWKADKCYELLLKPWLRIMKDKYGLNSYIWKYELQNRGNVHYHITLDVFIALDKIRGVWNKIQKKHGLTDKYALKHHHFNPNSTDVHKVWKIENIGAYLGKYLSKSGEGVVKFHEGFHQLIYERDVKGKVWDCSVNLKRKRYTAMVTNENEAKITELVSTGKATLVRLENCAIVRCEDIEKILTEDQKIDYTIWKYV